MTLADSNFWIALAIHGHQFHLKVANWFASQSRQSPFLFCRSTQQSFLRHLTTQAIIQSTGTQALTNTEAWAQYEQLTSDPKIDFAPEPADIEHHWKRLACRTSASPKVWMDAYLAAFAIAGGYQLVTSDKAFAQFPGLKVIIL